jgi:group I intron endonuclease
MTYKINPAIYKITNSANGMFYIGSALSVGKRWQQHRWRLKRGIHENQKLQHAWNKYGGHSFSIEILESVNEVSLIIQREQFWIDKLDPIKNGYNIAPFAGGTFGYKHTDDVKLKISVIHKGKVLPEWHREKLIAANTGRKHTEEEKAKISKANKNKKRTPDQIAAMSERLKGRVITAEWAANISAANKGKKKTAEHIEKIAVAHRGMKRSAQACANISASLVGRTASDETRMKMSAAKKGRKFSDEHRENIAKAARERWARKRAQQS